MRCARPRRARGVGLERPGLVGLHLLRHETPPLAATTEQKIRGNADRVADWVLVACGYDTGALRALGDTELGDTGLAGWAPHPAASAHLYGLACSATPADIH